MNLKKTERRPVRKKAYALLISAVLAFAMLITPAAAMASDESIITEDAGGSSEGLTAEEEKLAEESLENEDPEFYEYYELDEDGNILPKDTSEVTASAVNSAPVPSKYSTANGYKKYKAIDVSYHNGNIDWEKVKNAGITRAYIRVGYRGYGDAGNICSDTKYKDNINGAYAQGIKVGVYFYSQAITVAEAKEEANKTLSLIKAYKSKIKLQVAYDFEYSQGRLKRSTFSDSTRVSKQTSLCKAFCEKIRDGGYTPMIYANKTTLLNDLDYKSLQKSYKIWLAHYTNNTATDYPGKYYAWQFASDGSVSGISGNVDRNYIFVKNSVTYSLVSDNSGYKVKSSTGSYVKSRWVKISGKYYYVGSDGYCVKGVEKIGGKYYCFASNCAAREKVWISSGSNKYYCGAKGLIYTGYKKVGSYYYYFNSSGVMQKNGNKTYSGKKYRLLSNGRACIYRAVTTAKLNMRASASSSAETKGTVAKSKSIYVLRTSSGFAQLSNGYWVSVSYLKVANAYPYKSVSYKVKTKANLNVRTGPSSSVFKKTGMYKKGKTVKIVQVSGSWGKVAAGKWICLSYTTKL